METLRRNKVAVEGLVERLYGSPESVVPVVGAGMSVPTGCPTWRGFLADTIEQAKDAGRLAKGKYGQLKRLLNVGEYVKVADELWATCTLLVEAALKAQFRVEPRSIRGPVRLVPKLCWRLAITTNYDRILETVWEETLAKEGGAEKVDRLLPDDEYELDRALTGIGKVVMKLHGDVENTGSWVMTSEQTTARYGDPEGTIREFLVKLWNGKVPLFLGNSLVENPLIGTLREAKKTGYAVMPLSSPKEQKQLIDEHGDILEFIWLRPEDAGAGDIFTPLGPFLDLVARRARLRATVRDRPPVFLDVKDRFDSLKAAGRYPEIVNRIRKDAGRYELVERTLTILHYCDLGGLPEEGLVELANVRTKLDRHALSNDQKHALKYLAGRLLAQQGRFSQAISKHEKNLPARGIGDYFQIRSRFELGQLYFRAEDFGAAREYLADLDAVIEPIGDMIMVTVDVLKFLASLEVVKLLHDPPGHEDVGAALQTVDAAQCLAYAKDTLSLAESIDYRDGIAWAHTVAAFGWEAEGKPVEAEADEFAPKPWGSFTSGVAHNARVANRTLFSREMRAKWRVIRGRSGALWA